MVFSDLVDSEARASFAEGRGRFHATLGMTEMVRGVHEEFPLRLRKGVRGMPGADGRGAYATIGAGFKPAPTDPCHSERSGVKNLTPTTGDSSLISE